MGNKTIHEFDFELICEYFSSIERQGPGSPEVTIEALSFIDNLTSDSQITDIGCGTGGQTMILARHTSGIPGLRGIVRRRSGWGLCLLQTRPPAGRSAAMVTF